MAVLKEMLLNQRKLTVVFAGDSQTWGQGASGWKEALPDFAAGELRRLPDTVPSLVTMFKKHLAEIRGPEKETAVINSGVGSTSVEKYIKYYWPDMVIAHNPDIVVMMYAVNDWIHKNSVGLDKYRSLLVKMTEYAFSAGSEVVMITESPVLGTQFSSNHFYDDYVNAFRQTALSNPRILLADANKRMKKFLADGDYKVNSKILFEDRLHVSQTGHFIYLKVLTDAIGL